jgi:hypothetical protein
MNQNLGVWSENIQSGNPGLNSFPFLLKKWRQLFSGLTNLILPTLLPSTLEVDILNAGCIHRSLQPHPNSGRAKLKTKL